MRLRAALCRAVSFENRGERDFRRASPTTEEECFCMDRFGEDFEGLRALRIRAGIEHSNVEVSSAGLRLLSLSPGSFCDLASPFLSRPLHDDRMGAVYLERLDGHFFECHHEVRSTPSCTLRANLDCP